MLFAVALVFAYPSQLPPGHPSAPPEHLKEPLAYMRKAQAGWEKRVLKSLNSMSTELEVPLARMVATILSLAHECATWPPLCARLSHCYRVDITHVTNSSFYPLPTPAQRPAAEQKELAGKWNEMGTDEPGGTGEGGFEPFQARLRPKGLSGSADQLAESELQQQRGRRCPEPLGAHPGPPRCPGHPTAGVCPWISLHACACLQITNRACACLGVFQRQAYPELNLSSGQLGIDDHAHIHPDLFENEYVQIGQKVLSQQDSAAAQQYSRRGCPTGLRADVWALILNATNQPQDVMYYEQLKAGVIQHDLLVDNLIYKDVKLTASNDDYYFVFEDFLYQVLLCFSRDTSVLEHFAYNSATPPKSYVQGNAGDDKQAVFYPPNGVIPFHGFSMYVAPLCFLYNEPSKLYSVFKEMYIRYFFRLHSISSSPSGIVSLCLQFECLLQTYLPQLFYHLRQLGAQPLRIAFKWIVRAFSGYLSTDQLLILWDRILGYDSLEIVAILAAAVFAFRAENLMEVRSSSSAEAVLADLSTLKVMPLIQIFLFAT
ncbi:unnamed protein product, partial [Tetraodon nigroviridis]